MTIEVPDPQQFAVPDPEQFRKWRVLAGLEQQEIARRADLSQTAIQKIESDEHNPYRSTVEAVLAVYQAEFGGEADA